jgi:hypothetical protein
MNSSENALPVRPLLPAGSTFSVQWHDAGWNLHVKDRIAVRREIPILRVARSGEAGISVLPCVTNFLS